MKIYQDRLRAVHKTQKDLATATRHAKTTIRDAMRDGKDEKILMEIETQLGIWEEEFRINQEENDEDFSIGNVLQKLRQLILPCPCCSYDVGYNAGLVEGIYALEIEAGIRTCTAEARKRPIRQ